MHEIKKMILYEISGSTIEKRSTGSLTRPIPIFLLSDQNHSIKSEDDAVKIAERIIDPSKILEKSIKATAIDTSVS